MTRDDNAVIKFVWKDGYEREHNIGKYGCVGIRHKDNDSRPIDAEWITRPANKEEIFVYLDEVIQAMHGKTDRIKLAIKLLFGEK